MIQSMSKIQTFTNKSPSKGSTYVSNLKQWLFGVRLKFVQPEQKLESTIISSVKQDSLSNFKYANTQIQFQKITSEENIDQIYNVLRDLILSFKFDQKNNEKTYKDSKEVLRNKYKINDVESSIKKKIKKFQDIYSLDQSQTQQWKKILNHKNVIIHLAQAYNLAQKLFCSNFKKITEGKYTMRNKQLSRIGQIKLNILMMQIIILINQIKSIFLPAFSQQPVSKLQTQQKKILEQELNKLQSYKLVKQLKFKHFFQKIKLLLQELQDKEEKTVLKFWLQIFQIKKRFLLDDNGVWKRQRHEKIQSTYLDQMKIYWWHTSNQIVHKKFDPTNQQEGIKFMQIFRQYKILFNFILNQKTKYEDKQQKMTQIIKYLDLIQQVWIRVDQQSALLIFWEEIIKIYDNKITLPDYYLKKSQMTINKIKQKAIDNYLLIAENQCVKRIKNQVDDLSQNLIQLKEEDRLYADYMKKHYQKLRRLLKEKLFTKNFPTNLEEQLKKKPYYYNIQLIKTIKQRCHNLDLEGIPNNISFSQTQEDQTIQQLYEKMPKQTIIVDQLKYFLMISRCILFQNKTSTENLQICRNYYSTIRQKIFNKSHQQYEDNQNNSHGLKYAIRVLTYELIACIQLQRPEVQNLIKKIFNLLRNVYKLKTKSQQKDENQNQDNGHKQTIDDNLQQDNQEDPNIMRTEVDEQIQFKDIIMRRSSSQEINQNKFYIQDFRNGNNIENNNALIYLKKIYELRTQILANKIKSFRNTQQKFSKNYCELKRKIYQYAGKDYLNNQLVLKDISKLPQIQFDFERERYYDGWKKLRKLNNLELISKILNKNWSGSHNLAKIFINLFFQYKETCSSFFQSGELSQQKIKQLISKISSTQQKYMKQRFREAIKILDDIQKIQFLRKQRQQQLIQSSHQKRTKKKRTFPVLSQKVLIEHVQKNGIRIFKNYTIQKISNTCYTRIYEKIKKLSLLNRRIFVQGDKMKGSISIKIDQVQNSFESFPQAVRRLIKQYVQIIKFCRNQLHFDLYPLLWEDNLKVEKNKQNKIYYELNPYQGILLNILLSFQQIKQLGYYRYPKFPFIELADELRKKFVKIYQDKKHTAEYYTFYHLLQQMKAISMQPKNSTLEITAQNILKCPYFWSTSEKLFEIVQFKQIYQTGINVQQGRRKQNQKRRSQMSFAERQAFSTLQQKNQNDKNTQYKTAYGYHKTTQIYFSIEGVLQKQAFLENIGNFKDNNNLDMQQEEKNYKYHTYWWSKYQNDLIIKLIGIVAEREMKRGSQKSTVYEKTFNSFQNHIRNLRNLAVHYIYDTTINKQYDTQQKIRIFQQQFPKIFVFIYRWRNYIGKDFTNFIKPERINLLKQLFVNESNPEMIEKLESIQQLSRYNIINTNKALFKIFNYNYDKTSGCKPCGILCASMKKTTSFWHFLEDIQIEKQQKTKPQHDSRYNVLFFDHQKPGCNGLEYLLGAFFNSIQRNKFTSEQMPFISEQQEYEKDLRETNEESPKKSKVKIIDELSYDRRGKLMDELHATDYVCKYFIFQLEMTFPYLFYDIRKQRYQWDSRATEYPGKRQ